MPTSHTVTTIYNMALDIVSERPCSGPSDTGRAEVRWLNRNYVHYVQVALRENLWNFATELHYLSRGTDPAFRWSYAYDLPNGWLRVIPLTRYGARNEEIIPHEIRSGQIVTSELGGADGLPVELVMDRQDPGEWDPLFAALIAARLAVGLAHAFTHKRSFVDAAKQAAVDALNSAEMANAYEGTMPPVEQHDVIRARYR